MATCLWALCTCPTTMPCPEHQGIWCSRFFGRPVRRLADAHDATVTRALAALRDLRREVEQADAKVRDAEARKLDWERRRDAFEQRYQTVDESHATDLEAEGQTLGSAAEAEARRSELEVGDLRAAVRDPEGAAAFLIPLLHMPYHDPTGRCPCYRTKLRQLAAVGGRIGNARLDVQLKGLHLKAQLRSLRLLAAAVSIAVAGAVGLVALLGPVAFKAALVILLLAVIALLAQLIMLAMARAALLRAREALLKATLLYYRLQHVSTCTLPFPGWDQVDPEPPEGNGEPGQGIEGYLEELDAELQSTGRR